MTTKILLLHNKKSLKALPFLNVELGGIGGPKFGTSCEQLTATLKGQEITAT